MSNKNKNKVKPSPPDVGAMPPPSFMSTSMATSFASVSDKTKLHYNGNRNKMIAERRKSVHQKRNHG
jgi:hypothetical protein